MQVLEQSSLPRRTFQGAGQTRDRGRCYASIRSTLTSGPTLQIFDDHHHSVVPIANRVGAASCRRYSVRLNQEEQVHVHAAR